MPAFTSETPELQSNGLWRIVVNGQVHFYEWYSIAIAHLEMGSEYGVSNDDAVRMLKGGKHH